MVKDWDGKNVEKLLEDLALLNTLATQSALFCPWSCDSECPHLLFMARSTTQSVLFCPWSTTQSAFFSENLRLRVPSFPNLNVIYDSGCPLFLPVLRLRVPSSRVGRESFFDVTIHADPSLTQFERSAIRFLDLHDEIHVWVQGIFCVNDLHVFPTEDICLIAHEHSLGVQLTKSLLNSLHVIIPSL